MSSRLRNKSWAAAGRPAATAAVLLALFAHAFFVGTTHLHRAQNGGAAPAPVFASVGRAEGAQGAPAAGSDAQCLLCRLQRNLALGLRNAAPSLNPPRHEPAAGESLSEPFVNFPHLSHAKGRAPPSA